MKAEGRGRQTAKRRGHRPQGGDTDEPLSYVPAFVLVTLGHTHTCTNAQLWTPDPLLGAHREARPVQPHLGPVCQASPVMCAVAGCRQGQQSWGQVGKTLVSYKQVSKDAVGDGKKRALDYGVGQP